MANEGGANSGTGDCYDFTPGGMRVSALCDVAFDMEKSLLTGEPAEAIDACLPGAAAAASGTAYLARLPGGNVLVDAGAGEIFDGRVHEALAKTGVAPGEIARIFLTHLHLDHVGGLLRGGVPLFPNAEVWLAEEEHAFWHDDAATGELAARLAPVLGAEFIPTHVKGARESLAAYAGRVRLFSGKDGEREIVPGVTAVPLFGHTPGHCGYALGAGDDRLFIWGDAVHIAAVQFALPGAGMVFDWDAGAAVKSRRHAFDAAASRGRLAAGMHLPFPGAGRVRRDGDAYSFIPVVPGA